MTPLDSAGLKIGGEVKMLSIHDLLCLEVGILNQLPYFVLIFRTGISSATTGKNFM